jgi:hypothetical protein
MTDLVQGLTEAQGLIGQTPNGESPPSGLQGFSQKILRYFLNFLQTDFKKQQAPSRRIQTKSETGFRIGMPLRKYPALYKAAWKFASEAPTGGLTLRIAPGQYTAPVSPTLRDLIHQHAASIDAAAVERIIKNVTDYATTRRSKAIEDPEQFVESVQTQFVEETGTRIVHPMLALLDGPFRAAAYSAIESVYDVESELTDALTARVVESLPTAVNTLVVTGNSAPIKAIFDEFFCLDDIRARAKSFFDDFATADAFQEMRDLQHSLRSAENQSLYLYLCDIRFGAQAFPLFYIPTSLDYDEENKAFVLEFDPHLFVNKQAIDWILQERQGEATRLPLSPVVDRVLYLDGRGSFLDEMETVFSRLVPAFEMANDIDLRKPSLQHASSATLKISTAAWFSVFDKSDESLLNDYEELLMAFNEEQKGAGRLFANIVQGFLFDNPISVTKSVDEDWEKLPIADRLVVDSPIPLNEEQRKILTALRDSKCNYVSVQGPPGTGKSHTITALAFEGILSGQTVLVLSDKAEALDVAQDKLESVLSKVRHGDDDFPNPILRLGRSGNTYSRLVSASAREKIKTHYQAARHHAENLSQEITKAAETLRTDIGKTVETLSAIKLPQVEALHRLEKEIEAACPGLVQRLQHPAAPEKVVELGTAAAKFHREAAAAILSRISKEPGCQTLREVTPRLLAWQCATDLATRPGSLEPLSLFTCLEADQHPVLIGFLMEYESLRRPLVGWLFQGGKLQALNLRLGAALPCPDPLALHKRLEHLKAAARILGLINETLCRERLERLAGFVWRILREGLADRPAVADLAALAIHFSALIGDGPEGADEALGARGGRSLDERFRLIAQAGHYAALWHEIAAQMEGLPKTDYLATKTQLEQLNTARMTLEIDRRFLDFVDNKKATVKEIGGVIRGKHKFPENEFHHLSDAFPVIIAGIREYAEYVPLKQKLFDLVIIDEASQVSVAQALPAVLRAKKVVVFGDTKQFSNVKSAQASNVTNAGWLTDIEAYFRAHVSDSTTKLQRLKHFDVKKSVLEFFDLISNYQTMLRKHFRGYQELISFSSKHFYDSQLQAIKIRSKPVRETIRFEILEGATAGEVKNTNRTEAEFILKELRRMVAEEEDMTVGVITPFREQVKLLNEILFRDAYGERFESEFRLKIMTFDTCQGEERDLIIYSMVATSDRDVLNYVFPVDLTGLADKAEEAVKAQRLNVGFSRAKEAFLFVLSQPVDRFHGAIGGALMHFKGILEDRARPDEASTDPHSPMERKVLDWLYKTPFVQQNEDDIEIVPQFPVGAYLKQLDPFYSHPAYRCDFLVRYYDAHGSINVIIEYDGFAEHFVERQKIHSSNWDHYYRPEDVERQMVIETYGYKFLRLNRFNLGTDPVTSLSERLYELIKVAPKARSTVMTRIKNDVESLEEGSKRRCPKCGEIRKIEDFWDRKLKSGHGGYGRNCLQCKPRATARATSDHRATQSRGRRRWRY